MQREAPAPARMIKIGTEPATPEALESDGEQVRKGSMMGDWIDRCQMIKKRSSKLNRQIDDAEVPPVRCGRVAKQSASLIFAKQSASRTGTVDMKPFKYHCSTDMVAAKGEARGK